MIDAEIVARVDSILDRQVAQIYKDQPLAQDWARIAKLAEELGETISELILDTGQNPRKARDPEAYARMLDELADTAMTAVYALQHFTKDARLTAFIMQRAQERHLNRLEQVNATPPKTET